IKNSPFTTDDEFKNVEAECSLPFTVVTDINASSSKVSKINLETQICELESQLNAEKRKSEENFLSRCKNPIPYVPCIDLRTSQMHSSIGVSVENLSFQLTFSSDFRFSAFSWDSNSHI
ncbi:unnamed protein product, partial [Schistosoma intercalatum]